MGASIVSVVSDHAVQRFLGGSSPGRALSAMPVTTLFLDTVLIAVAGRVGVLGRQTMLLFGDSADVTESVGAVGPLMLLGWLAMIAIFGGYREEVFGAGTDEYKRVVNATPLRRRPLGRRLLPHAVPALARLLPADLRGRSPDPARRSLRPAQVLHAARRRGSLTRSVLIAGTRSHIDDVARVLARESWLGYRVIGALTPDYDQAEETASGVPVLGNTDEVARIAAERDADVIFFAGGSVGSAAVMRKTFWTLEQQRVGVVVAPSVTDVSSERVTVRPVGGLPLIHVDPPTWSDASRWGKRLFDVVGSAGLILLLSPVMLALALWVAIERPRARPLPPGARRPSRRARSPA